jgi:serine protease AprX
MYFSILNTQSMRNWSLLFLVLLVQTFSFAQDTAWEEKVSDRVWASLLTHSETPVVIMMSDQKVITSTSSIKGKINKGNYVYTTLRQHAEETQSSLRAFLTEQGVSHHSFYLVNAISTRADRELLRQIAERDDVSMIIEDGLVRVEAYQEVAVPALSPRSVVPDWGIRMIKADSVWDQFDVRGEGIIIGGQDTGYKWDLPQIKKQYRGYLEDGADHNYNWHDAIRTYHPIHADSINPCGLDLEIPCDDHNHGTHTMGTMVGTDSSLQIGVAPAAQWIGCRNMERGYGSPSTYTECFEWFLAPTDLNGENPRPDLAPHVINNSWGCPEFEGCNEDNFEMMSIVVQNLKSAGIVVVVSAGNDGSNCYSIRNPAAIFEASFTVGASNRNDTITNFSSRGLVLADGSMRLKPNVVAPGAGITSVIRDSSLVAWNGTSMAGPHVAGAVALLLSAVPALAGEVDVIEDILEQSAVPKYSLQSCGMDSLQYPNATFGYGRIDILSAVKMARAMFPTATSEVESSFRIDISPNPANERLRVQVSPFESPYTLHVYASDGALIMSQELNEEAIEFNIQHWNPGVYIIHLNNGKQSLGKRVLVVPK